MNKVHLIQKLINLEIDNQEVAGPVDILSITRYGPHWIYLKPQCPDIQPYTEQQKKPAEKRRKGV
jgi:hypothetical protein